MMYRCGLDVIVYEAAGYVRRSQVLQHDVQVWFGVYCLGSCWTCVPEITEQVAQGMTYICA